MGSSLVSQKLWKVTLSKYSSFIAMILYFHIILRYNTSNRGRDFWDTLYIFLKENA